MGSQNESRDEGVAEGVDAIVGGREGAIGRHGRQRVRGREVDPAARTNSSSKRMDESSLISVRLTHL